MCSLDVSSLFTNVPLFETVDFICDYIIDNNITIPIPTSALKELLLRCTFNIQFKFNGKFYRQIDGVAMGSPLGPILADIFMGILEYRKLRNNISEMCLYRRYVDDIFAVLQSEEMLSQVVTTFSGAHPNIGFTSETESDGVFHFLDVGLERRLDGSLRRYVYRKPTWTGQYTHFNSFVPVKQKRNLVHCLRDRAIRICTPDSLDEELKSIRNTLRLNGYPDRFINKNMTRRTPTVTETVHTVERKPIYIKLPFKGDLAADQINRRLYLTLRRTFPSATLRSWFTARPLISLDLKDKVSVHDQSMVVYSFSCCCAAEYIGRTTRCLSQRIKEHHPAWLNTGSTKSIRSSVVAHLVDTNHRVDTTKAFNIVYRVPPNQPRAVRERILSIAESIAIRLRNPVLCAQKQFTHTLKLSWPRVTAIHPTSSNFSHPSHVS